METPFSEGQPHVSNQEIQERLAKTRNDLATASEKYSIGSRSVDIEELEAKIKDIKDPIERMGAENIISEIKRIREGRS